MLFWFVVFMLSLFGVGAIVWPMVNAKSEYEPEASAGDLLKARLAAIQQDKIAGLIEEAVCDEAILEAKKHALETQVNSSSPVQARLWRIAALFFLGATPLAAVVIYLNIGSPASLRPNTDQTLASATTTETLDEQTSSLEARVRTAPEDYDAWMRLGQSYATSGRADDAVKAFTTALELEDEKADAHAALGEALVMQANGAITAEARTAFEKALKVEPTDPRSQYYLAEGRYQVGAIDEAAERWASLINNAPVDAPWLPAVGARLMDAAKEAGLDLNSIGLADGPAQWLGALARGELSESGGDLTAVLGRLHDGSASYEDWLLAATIYVERGDADRAREILDRAEEVYQGAPFVLGQINEAMLRLENGQPITPTQSGASVRGPSSDQVQAVSALPEGEQKAMIAGMVEGLADRLKREPDDIEGWRMLARSYRVLGDQQESLAAYQELTRRSENNPDDWRDYAFTLLAQRPEGDNTVSDTLLGVLEKLQVFIPDDPFALYHLGFAARQRGDSELAISHWRHLLETMADDVSFQMTVEQLITETENS